MAVALDATTGVSFGFTTGSTLTQAHTCTGSDRLLIVQASSVTMPPSQTVSSVTYAGAAMTQLTSTNSFYEYSKTAPSTGSNNVVITMSAYVSVWRVFASFTGVDQTTPTGTVVTASGSSSAPSTGSVTCPANGMVFGGEHSGYTSGSAPTITAGTMTGTALRDGGSGETMAAGRRTTTGAITFSISSSPTWHAAGVPINAVAVASAPPISLIVGQGVKRAGSY